MKIFFVGPIYGKIEDTYSRITDLAKKEGEPDWVIQLGNFGAWPDPNHIDRATRLKGEPLEFPSRYLAQKPLPYRTIFIAGAHEDHQWLNRRRKSGDMEILPNLSYLINGYKTLISDGTRTISVVGLGKVYSPKFFNSRRTDTRYYVRSEIERACSQGKTDLFISHAPPDAKGIKDITFAIRPKHHVFSNALPEGGLFAHEIKVMII